MQGKLFMRALKLLVLPLIVVSMLSGVLFLASETKGLPPHPSDACQPRDNVCTGTNP